MDIDAKKVMAFRAKTGLSMMECKNALIEAGGDEEKAMEILRKKGLAAQSKRAANTTAKGRVAVWVDPSGTKAGIAELRCETEPVATTDEFIALTQQFARHAALTPGVDAESIKAVKLIDDPSKTLGDLMDDVFNKMRENMRVGGVGRIEGPNGFYVHHNAQVGVVVEFNAACPEPMRTDVCMHIAAMKPPYLRREEVDPELVAKERVVAAEQMKDKPANMVEKIVDGKIGRWYGEICLLEQPFVKDDKKTVQQALTEASKGLTINKMICLVVGG